MLKLHHAFEDTGTSPRRYQCKHCIGRAIAYQAVASTASNSSTQLQPVGRRMPWSRWSLTRCAAMIEHGSHTMLALDLKARSVKERRITDQHVID